MKLKILLACMLFILILVGGIIISWSKKEENANDPKAVINKLFTSINQKDWDTYVDLHADINKNNYIRFLNNPANKKNEQALFNIKSAKVEEIQLLPDILVSGITKLFQYKENYSEVQSYLVGIDFKVKNENKYHFNGVNYRLIVLVKENNEWKVIEMSSFPMHVLDSYINTKWDDLSCKQKVFYSEQLLYRCLFPFISDVIEEYYGGTRSWMNFKIIYLEGFYGSDVITVQVESFTDSHNPPYGISTFNFEISFQNHIKLLEYQHIEEEE